QAGVPTVPPLTRADGARLSEFQGKPVAVFPWIQGEMFCQARVTPEASEKVGAALAEVHLATEALTRLPPGRFRVEDLYQRLDRIEQGAPTEYGDAARRVRSEIQRCVSERDPVLPQGVIHGDLFRDNVLWEKGEIRALIDFESASHGAFLYDLMVTLLAWCFSDRFDADLVDAMLRGYSERRKLTLRELDAAVTECKLGCLRFATTRITDFAMRAPPGAAPARDYRRMLSRLEALESGALSPALARLRGR
ncbi:MAG TPA: homoserine kinase, partial [Polyangiaceae bacterium]